LFEVSADRKRLRCVHISAIGGDSDNPDGGADRFEEDARQAVEEFLRPSSAGVDRERLATFYECADDGSIVSLLKFDSLSPSALSSNAR
jgi:hypothetical protein